MILYNTKISQLLIDNNINADNISIFLSSKIIDSVSIVNSDLIWRECNWNACDVMTISHSTVGTAILLPSIKQPDYATLYFINMDEMELESYLIKLFKLKTLI